MTAVDRLNLSAIRDRIQWHQYRASSWEFASPPEGDVTRCGGCGRPDSEHPIPNATGVQATEVIALIVRVEELEAALDLALGHMRHEDDCTWTIGLQRGEGLSQGGPGVVCNCGNQDAVRRVLELIKSDI